MRFHLRAAPLQESRIHTPFAQGDFNGFRLPVAHSVLPGEIIFLAKASLSPLLYTNRSKEKRGLSDCVYPQSDVQSMAYKISGASSP